MTRSLTFPPTASLWCGVGEGLTGLVLLSSRLVAHFSPSGMWNTRTFSSWNESSAVWTLRRAVFAVGGLECLLLLTAAAIQAGYDDSLVAKCFNTAIKSVTTHQEDITEFLNLGGFSLLSHILKMCHSTPGPFVVQTFLNNSSHVTQTSPGWNLLTP